MFLLRSTCIGVHRDPDRLAWLALIIVDEAAEHAEKRGQVQPTIPLRFALAFLCSRADGPLFAHPDRRAIFDAFWRTVTEPDGAGPPNMVGYGRASHTRSALQQIGRQLQFGPGIFHTVRDWRSPEARTRRAVAKALALGNEERARRAWRKRGGYFGRPYPGDQMKPDDDD